MGCAGPEFGISQPLQTPLCFPLTIAIGKHQVWHCLLTRQITRIEPRPSNIHLSMIGLPHMQLNKEFAFIIQVAMPLYISFGN